MNSPAVQVQVPMIATPAAPDSSDAWEIREDGWWNTVTGLGAPGGKDTSTRFDPNPLLQFQELANMFYGDDLSYRIVSKLPKDALKREPLVKNTAATPEQVQKVQKRLRALGWVTKFKNAGVFSRLFGNAGVLVATMSEQTEPMGPAEPVRFLRTVDRRSLLVAGYYVTPTEEKHGTPERYGLIPIGMQFSGTYSGVVHETRIRMLRGTELDQFQRAINGGWDYSVLQRCINAVRDMGETWAGVSYLLRELSIKVLQTANLAQNVAQNPGLVRFRLDLANQMLAVNRLMVIDKDKETFDRKDVSALNGVAALVEQVLLRLSAAAEMPVTQLYGRSPSGLNATGESDENAWYDRVETYQEQDLKPAMLPVVQQVGASMFPGIPAETWDMEFPPLKQESPSDVSTRRKAVADMDAVYISNGVFSAEAIAVLRASGNWDPDYSGVDVTAAKALLRNPNPSDPDGDEDPPPPVPAPPPGPPSPPGAPPVPPAPPAPANGPGNGPGGAR